MMTDIATAALLTFSFTAANHLGLVSKIEELTGHNLPVINCPRCASFWSILLYCIVASGNVIGAVAMSFFFAYLALWLELAMCVVDYLYKKIYEKIISDSASDKAAASTHDGDAASPLPKLRKK